MLRGIDVSRYQRNMKSFAGYDFVIMKATEGVTLTDICLNQHYNNLTGTVNGKPDKKKLYGFYHYAHPENNTPEKEAEHFLSKVGHHKGNCLFVLDWEQKALKYDIQWAIKWLDYVFKKTGVRPLIYCQASYTKNLKKVLDKNYGLWVAHYGVTKPAVKVYPSWVMWQYTSTPIDKNYFNGTEEQFRKYCAIVKE